MRTIKFRGRDLEDTEWIYGWLTIDPDEDTEEVYVITTCDIDRLTREVIPETVGQFTGLKDKNGQEIYEGDIVQEGRFVYAVEYNANRYASFGLRRDGDMFMHYFGEALEADECEVIGNIHENPELLKPKQP